MRTYTVFFSILGSCVLVLGCGGRKHKHDGDRQQSEQPETPDTPNTNAEQEPGSADGDGKSSDSEKQPVVIKKPGSAQPAPQPTPPNPIPPDSGFGQIVQPTQDSIQSKLVNLYCVACHHGDNPPAYLNLEDLSLYVSGELGAGGYRGILLVPGKSSVSALYLVMGNHQLYAQMPPVDNVLGIPAVNQQQIKAVADWIDSLPVAQDAF